MKGTRERTPQGGAQVARIGLAERVAPELAQDLEEAGQAAEGRDGHLGEVFAALEVRGMRASTSVDDRVVADLHEGRVVPATPQLVPGVVVRRSRDPDRSRPIGSVLEVDEDLFPVGLVVVGAIERGAVVVHEVEVEVVKADPAGFTARPAPW